MTVSVALLLNELLKLLVEIEQDFITKAQYTDQESETVKSD
jgi:hypothetical protein